MSDVEVIKTDLGDVSAKRKRGGPWRVSSPWGGFRFYGTRGDVRKEMANHIAVNNVENQHGNHHHLQA